MPSAAGPSWPAFSSDMISAAAAPSEICDELAAVISPFSTKQGGSEANFS